MPFPMTRVALLLASILLLPPARTGGAGAPNAGAPGTLRFRWLDAGNLHIGNPKLTGAEHTNNRGEVIIELLPDERARVSDGGELQGSSLDGDRFTETTTVWKTTWEGVRRSIGAKLRFELVRGDSSCKTTVTTRWGATTYRPERKRCSGGRERLVLVCEQTVIKAGAANDLSDKTRPTPAWSCDAARPRPGSSTESSLPWVLGTERCLERRGGGIFSGPFRYLLCEK